jgi:hypothetical protein
MPGVLHPDSNADAHASTPSARVKPCVIAGVSRDAAAFEFVMRAF